ncbi:FprA family A-type flavoprotein [Caldisalinibacter kiritimatiensis]|uniref:Putative flavoprotein n=1 Tax=Caldisalinibacter kiritimatiensis TaxID=1304284 RepID=R1CCM4_9FIRM|nr:FprA family A-type flavoprotein [Caldisalinibacter kiritimatiensis]EOD00025.1 Putative flavoprotein [Caldisalinibacter kiritimatiensis]
MEKGKVLEVKKGIKWIGILDPDLVTFDVVMETEYGTTYNSYFIDADKKAIVETSKEKFKDLYLEKVKSVVDPEEIEYIILNHTEPDHSGNLRHLLRIAPNATMVGSKGAINFLKNMVDVDFEYMIVNDGDILDLGNKTLRFISAPFLHWPDSIYTYLEEDNILFTCDSFGCHFCDDRMFDDSLDDFDDAFKYYFDVILKPFSNYMLQAINKIEKLDIDIICPGHGPILREKWRKYVELSQKWAKAAVEKPKKPKVFIPYVSAYGNTAKLAEKIAEGIKEAGDIDVDVVDIEMMNILELEERVEKSTAIIIGSPTINQNILLPIYKLFAVINPITNRGKLAAAFGSYGWSGEGVKIIESHLKNLKLKIIEGGPRIQFVPYEEALNKCVEFGKEFGEKLMV